MFRLTREVRFSISAETDAGMDPSMGNCQLPTDNQPAHYFALRVELAGPLDPKSSYLQNIKRVDELVRGRFAPRFRERIDQRQFGDATTLLRDLLLENPEPWPGVRVASLALALNPFLSASVRAEELPMVRLSQKFEFSAAHRLHNPELSYDQNFETFGKCNNPHGHGHNYVVQVTLRGEVDGNGLLIPIPALQRIVNETVIERFDHKHLNVECEEFRHLNPSVENISRVIYGLLKPRLASRRAHLASVTVWETEKTWSEYSE